MKTNPEFTNREIELIYKIADKFGNEKKTELVRQIKSLIKYDRVINNPKNNIFYFIWQSIKIKSINILNRLINKKMDSIKIESPEQLIKKIGELERVPVNYNTLKTRKREIVLARQIASTLIRSNFIKLKLYEIGAYFNNQGHDNIIHSHKTIDNLLQTDKEFRIKFNNYLKYLNLKYRKYGKT